MTKSIDLLSQHCQRDAQGVASTRGTIRSFSLRQGRMTLAQRNALASLWPVYGLASDWPIEPRKVFGRNAPLIVEIGFGNGDSLFQMATARPDLDFVGIEVHRPGVGHLLLNLAARNLPNIRICCADAVEVLARSFADSSVAGINLFFPDPWPKKRHHKRRLVNSDFVRLAARKLIAGGYFHAATDWEDYAVQMMRVFSDAPQEFFRLAAAEQGATGLFDRPATKFEDRGRRLGHAVWDLVYIRREVVAWPEPTVDANG